MSNNPGLEERMNLLADRIKFRLKELGLKRKQFAAMMGVKPPMITRWLSGTHNFEIKTLMDIEWVLNIEIFIL